MDLSIVLSEIHDKVADYKVRSLHMKKEELQKLRDELSALNTTLAYMNADFYEDSLASEFKRKIEVAKAAERLLFEKKAKSSAEAERKALIECEPFYIDERTASSANTRCKLIKEQVNTVINSIASRLHISNE